MALDSHFSIVNTLKNWWQKRGGKKLQVAPATEQGRIDYVDRNLVPHKQIIHLRELVDYNYKKMKCLREAAEKMRKQYNGHLAWEQGAAKEQPVIINKLQDAVRIWFQNMATGSPKLSLQAEHPHLRSFAWNWEHAVNKHLEEIKIGQAFAVGTLDSFFSAGLFKTGLSAGSPGVYDDHGELVDYGRAFTDAVYIDDMIIDTSAKNPDRVELIGDYYMRPKEWVKDQLKRARRGDPFDGISDPRESENRPQDLITGNDQAPEHRVYGSEQTRCYDLYLPNENLMITLPDGHDEPIAMWEWDGPEGGPYDMMNLLPVSGAPIAPGAIQSTFELHMFANEIMRKVGRQANRQKDMIFVEEGSEEAGNRIRESKDGYVITVPRGILSGEKIKQFSNGGANPLGAQILQWTLQQFDTEAGNLQSLGGLGPSAETFRGDKLIHDTASTLIRFLQMRLQDVAKSVLKKHMWWTWTEEIREYEGYADIPGTDIPVPWTFTPEERSGDFLDYNFKIVPASMVNRTPEEQAQLVSTIINEQVMPLSEILMQDGYMPNAAETIKYVCKQYGVPFDIVLKALDPQMQQQMLEQSIRTPPRLSHTVNERVSRPGTTPNGQANEFMRSMASMGGEQQQAS